jgi:hypothetical protein
MTIIKPKYDGLDDIEEVCINTEGRNTLLYWEDILRYIKIASPARAYELVSEIRDLREKVSTLETELSDCREEIERLLSQDE